MKLMLMRHADAEPGGSYPEDALRPLTPKGRHIQGVVGQALHRMGLRPDRVLCSPRLRAWETAEISCEQLGCAEPQEAQALDGGYTVEELGKALVSLPVDFTILCVGHEPDMSTWASELLCAGAVRVKFPKSGVLGLAFDGYPCPASGTLQYFYRPDDLVALIDR